LTDLVGIKVVAVMCTTSYGAFSCLQIMYMSMREVTEREVIVQLEWVYGYERLFEWCSMSEETRRPNPRGDVVEVEIEKENLNLGRPRKT
jgi:hypothetical protein